MVRVLVAEDKELFDIALKQGYSDIIEELIQKGIDINYVNADKDTPLTLAIKFGRSDIAEKLIQKGADINHVDEDKNTPFILAISYHRPKIIQSLLEAGAYVNHVNKYGRTALMEAVIKLDLNTVQTLLQTPEITTGSFFGFGIKPINYADKDGNTALILAIKGIRSRYRNDHEYRICMNSQKIVNELLETPGIDSDHVNNNGETAVMLLEELNKKMNCYQY